MDEEMPHKRQKKGKRGWRVNLELTLRSYMYYKRACKYELQRVPKKQKVFLDSKTWANLPESVFFSIFKFLCWDDVFRFQTVCQDWNSFLRSSGFRMNWQKDSDQIPICFASSSSRNSFWNPHTEKWHASCDDLPPSLFTTQSDILMNVSKNTRGRHFPVVSAGNGYVLVHMYTRELLLQFAAAGDRGIRLKKYSESVLRFDLDLRDDFMAAESDIEPVLSTAASHGSMVSDLWLEHTDVLLIVNPLLPRTKENIKAVRPYQDLQDNFPIVYQHEIVWDPKLCSYELLFRSADLIGEDENDLWSTVFYRYDFVLDRWKKIGTWSTYEFVRFESSLIIDGKLVCLGRPFTMPIRNVMMKIKPYCIYWMDLKLPKSGSIKFEEMDRIAPILPFRLGFATLFYYEGIHAGRSRS